MQARPVHERGLHTWLLPLLCLTSASLLLHTKDHLKFKLSLKTPVRCCRSQATTILQVALVKLYRATTLQKPRA